VSNKLDDAWHVLIPLRLRAPVERIAEREDRHPAYIVRKLLDRALQRSRPTSPGVVTTLPAHLK
jgi:hypothetical protein